MSKLSSIEDLFLAFGDMVLDPFSTQVPYPDYGACENFYNIIKSNNLLTKNQANFAVKLLNKYNHLMLEQGIDAKALLASLKWKNTFRELDFTKRCFVEQDEDKIWYCFKFPYQLKEIFDKEFSSSNSFSSGVWDSERRIRKLDFYSYSVIQVLEFLKKHQFEIDQSVLDAEDESESIWENKESIEPYAVIENNMVVIRNATEEAEEFFSNNKKNSINDDLMLVKQMNYVLRDHNPKTHMEKIASVEKNSFWLKNTESALRLFESLDTKICLIMDRSSDYISWIKELVKTADILNIDKSKIKVCFRESKDSDHKDLNSWIKSEGLGGPISQGKLFIFLNSPAKWLYKDLNSFTIVATNMINPPTNNTTQSLFRHHPCIIYIGDIRPTKFKEKQIVEL